MPNVCYPQLAIEGGENCWGRRRKGVGGEALIFQRNWQGMQRALLLLYVCGGIVALSGALCIRRVIFMRSAFHLHHDAAKAKRLARRGRTRGRRRRCVRGRSPLNGEETLTTVGVIF